MSRASAFGLNGLLGFRPTLSPLLLNMLVAGFIMAEYNQTFWQRNATIFDGSPLLMAIFGAAVWALTLFILTLLGFRWLQKPVIVFLLIVSAVTSYYQDTLGATIDREMIQNAMTTTVTESKHLITMGFITHVFLSGVLPALLVVWVRIRPMGLLRNIWTWGLSLGVSFALCVGLLLTNMQAYSVVLRGNKELMASYQPGAPLAGTIRYARMMMKTAEIVVEPYGLDAVSDEARAAAAKPVLLVIVAGETARAQNFSLGGYARETNPELAKRDIVYYPNASSCGTATAVSLPCMFSRYGREEYSYEKGLSSENMLDILARTGYHVEWWDNNTGDKGNAARLTSRSLIKSTDPRYCADGECTDGIFLDELANYAKTMTEDTVLVLHMIGSHGPAYYLRYPPEFRRFTPTCDTGELSNCTVDEIVNTYDNTILYTDHILASMIDILEAEANVTPALFYASDHGESLGENGLFLHGAPYFLAPEYQTRVPMFFWAPERFTKPFAIDMDCLKAGASAEVSHDNMFHSLLTFADVHSEVIDRSLDLVDRCHASEASEPATPETKP
jgi:lipid A ethanolaminephosphotransferase